jgi:hypothetical protein
MAKVNSDRELMDMDVKALVDALGYSGAARFLRHFSKTDTDYIKLQRKLFKGVRLEQLYKKASEHHSTK